MNEVINRHFSHLTEPLELLGVVYPAPISKPLTIDKVKVHAEKLNNCNSNHAKEIAGRIFKILNDCK